MKITGTNNIPLGKRGGGGSSHDEPSIKAEESPMRFSRFDREVPLKKESSPVKINRFDSELRERESDRDRNREYGRDRSERDRDRRDRRERDDKDYDRHREGYGDRYRERGRDRREQSPGRHSSSRRGEEDSRRSRHGVSNSREDGREDHRAHDKSDSAKAKDIKEGSQMTNENGEPKRKSRWGDSSTKVNLPGMPTTLPSNMPPEQIKKYLTYLRLEEIGIKLRTNDIVPPEDRRSPSPEPVYNTDGKRVNTREFRYRKKLEDERHKLIEQAIKENPDFKPPADYKRPSKLGEKFFIPAKDHPEINFIGLLIGPRGNTLKKMETESGCKISIRGKGSVKEGRRNDAAPIPGIDEELHCLITGDSDDKIRKAIRMIEKIIETSASVPEGQNELKRQQLRELASLNGTLRDDENQICPNCGAVGHRRFECPETQNFTVNLVCKICTGVGHTARDCMQRHDPEALELAKKRDQKLDQEYVELMKELGEDDSNLQYPSTNTATGAQAAYNQGEVDPNNPGAAENAAAWEAYNAANQGMVDPNYAAYGYNMQAYPGYAYPGMAGAWDPNAYGAAVPQNYADYSAYGHSIPPPPPPVLQPDTTGVHTEPVVKAETEGQ